MSQVISALGTAGGWVSSHPVVALGLCVLVGVATTLTAARKG